MSVILKKLTAVTLALIMLILIPVFNISSESVWEGSAALGRYGEFPNSGLYGASNSFPKNSFVEVENIENGKRVRVIIVDRLDNSGLLMLLSTEAGGELGIYRNDISRIRVKMISDNNAERSIMHDDLAYNPDPDLNPAASLTDPESMVYGNYSTKTEPVLQPELNPEPEVETLPEPETEAVPEVTEVPEVNEPVEIAEAAEAETTVNRTADTEAVEPVEAAETAVQPEVEAEPEILPPVVTTLTDDDRGYIPEEPELRLLSSGLRETAPVREYEANYRITNVPQKIEAEDPEIETLTEASDYYYPASADSELSREFTDFPSIYIPEQLMAVLVGDSEMAEAYPMEPAVSKTFTPSPGLPERESEDRVLVAELSESAPLTEDYSGMSYDAVPQLPGKADRTPIEVADGYVEPVKEDYAPELADLPDVAGNAAEIPSVDDIEFSDAPDEIAEAPVDETLPEPEKIPEYREDVTISMEPAEARPPVAGTVETMEGTETEAEKVPEPESEPEKVIVAEVEAVPEEDVPEAAASAVVAPAGNPERIVMAAALEQSYHYLQIGSFREKSSAVSAAGKLNEGYPLIILTDSSAGVTRYKLLVGPLSADESGALLYNFRSGGYADAFVRRLD